jgi:uncharacterized membrane protein YvbJ
MSYCPKCGNKIEERMVFCPHCGTSLKGAATPSQAPPVQPYQKEKQEKNQNPEKGEKHEKSEYDFVGYLVGGLILITIAAFALLDLTHPANSSQDLAAMLLVIGVIIIIAGIYVATAARKRFPSTKSNKPSQKHAVKTMLQKS